MPKKPALEIKKHREPNRREPFYFNIPASRSSTGKRERPCFATKSEARTARQLELTRISNFGTSQATMPAEARRDAARAYGLLAPHDISLLEAVQGFLEAKEVLDPIGCSVMEAAQQHFQREIARARSCSFEALMDEFVAAKKQERLSGDYLKQIKRTKEAICPKLGKVQACDLTTRELSHSLSQFDDRLARP